MCVCACVTVFYRPQHPAWLMAASFPGWAQIDGVRSVGRGWRQGQEESRSWLPLRDKCLGLDLAGTHTVQPERSNCMLSDGPIPNSFALCSQLKRFEDGAGLQWAKGCWKVRYLANPGGLERPRQPWPGIFILPKCSFFGLQSIKNAFSHSDFRVIVESLHSQVCDYTWLTLHEEWEVRWIFLSPSGCLNGNIIMEINKIWLKKDDYLCNTIEKVAFLMPNLSREAIILDSRYRLLV